MKNQTHVSKIDEYIFKCLQKGELNNDNLVQIIERLNDYLNLKTISKYAKDHNKSYNGIKNNREVIQLFGCKFIADNK
jgi:hypothetical protein